MGRDRPVGALAPGKSPPEPGGCRRLMRDAPIFWLAVAGLRYLNNMSVISRHRAKMVSREPTCNVIRAWAKGYGRPRRIPETHGAIQRVQKPNSELKARPSNPS